MKRPVVAIFPRPLGLWVAVSVAELIKTTQISSPAQKTASGLSFGKKWKKGRLWFVYSMRLMIW
jgi:hypothetical protein